ncbi:MAG: spore germination protein GerW family protein [Anaerolineae bacterium]
MNESVSAKALDPLYKWLDGLNVRSIFGEPVHEGNTVVIPVASMRVGFGYGSGSGPQPNAEGEGEQAAPAGEGAGAGGGGSLQPVGYLRITADDVKFEAITDNNLVSLAGIGMVAWNVFWVAAAIRAFAPKRSRSEE